MVQKGEIDNVTFIKEFGEMADIILTTKVDPKGTTILFDNLFHFLDLTFHLSAANVETAKDLNSKAIFDIRNVLQQKKNLGDGADGSSIAASVFGLLSAFCWFIPPPAGEAAGMALQGAALATTLGSVATSVVDLANNPEKTIEKIEADEKAKLSKQKAFEALESMSVMDKILDGFTKKHPQAKMAPLHLFMSMATSFEQAREQNINNEAEAKSKFKNDLKLCADIVKNPDYDSLFSAASKLTDDEMEQLEMILKKVEPILEEALEKATDNNIPWYEDEVVWAKVIKGIPKVSTKVVSAIKALSSGKAVLQNALKGIKMVNNIISSILKGFTLKRVRVRRNAIIRIDVKPVEMKNLAKGAEEIAKDSSHTVKATRWAQATKSERGAMVGWAVLDVAGIAVGWWSIHERNKESQETEKKLQEAMNNFSDAMDELLAFKEVFFHSNDDTIRQTLDLLRPSALQTNRNAFQSRVNNGENINIGMVIDNRSSFTFDVKDCGTLLGYWYFEPGGVLVGTDQIRKDVRESRVADSKIADFVRNKKYKQVTVVAGWSTGSGVSAMLLLEARGPNKIQIPLWMFYGWNKPWECFCAYANIPGTYSGKSISSIQHHVWYEANAVNYIWNRGSDTDGRKRPGPIENHFVKIEVTRPAQMVTVTIRDRELG